MVTGHRPQFIPEQNQEWVELELERIAVKLRDQHGMQIGITGLALGADTWWGFATLYAWCELWSFLPFPQQADRWSTQQVAQWRELQERSSHVVKIADQYSVQALHARNDAMLANSELVVAVWDPAKTTGGTASAVEKAQQLGLPILHVDPIARTTTARGMR